MNSKLTDGAWDVRLHRHRSREAAVREFESLPAPTLRLPGKPFTVGHFAAFARKLVLDSGQLWKPEPFQLNFLAEVFAGTPECWLIVPEGNGKTTLIAGLALYVCEFSSQPVDIPVAASSMEQAQILYRQAEGFILRSAILRDEVYSPIQAAKGRLKLTTLRFQVAPGRRRIDHYLGSHIQVISSDARTGDGVIFRLAVLDELHRHRNLDLYRTWAGKRAKRGGQLVVISTAGEPESEFEVTRERIRQEARSREEAGGFVRAASAQVVLHEWALTDPRLAEDLAAVKGVNPFSKITVQELASKRASPTMDLLHWLRFTCNLPTRAENAAITEAEWFTARTKEEIPAGEAIWLGLDVAWKWDTTAAVPFWMPKPEQRLFGRARVLVPPRDGSSLDPDLVERTLLEIHARNPVHTVVMDPSKAEQLAEWIRVKLGATVVERTQGNQFAVEDYERFMEALRLGQLHYHAADKALTAHALHAVAKILPSGQARFDRPSRTREGEGQAQRVIDALTAAAMVHSAAVGAAFAPEPVELMGAWA